MSSEDETKAKIIKANKILQAKVGMGPLDERAVRRSQTIIDENDVEFGPLAAQYLDQLLNAIDGIRTGRLVAHESLQTLTECVMQLKANAGIFHYRLIGNLANVMLGFLEHVKNLDSDALAIITAHHKTLSVIVAKRMKGDGGLYGQQLEEELKNACARYFSRK